MPNVGVEVKFCQSLPSHLLQAVSCLADFSTLKMQVIISSETSVPIRTTRRYIPEDGNVQFKISFFSIAPTYMFSSK
jgi:hypothetical protein